jgi:ankyrin repeat protein
MAMHAVPKVIAVVLAFFAASACIAAPHNTPLIYLIKSKHATPAKVRVLIAQGAKVNATDKNDCTALSYAIHEHRIDLVKTLIAAHASLRATSEYTQRTPLIDAIASGDYACAKLLINSGAKVNNIMPGDVTISPLYNAAGEGRLDLVKLLVTHGAHVDGSGDYGETPLMGAAAEGNLDCLLYLIRHGAQVNKTAFCHTPLEDAVSWGHADCVEALLDKGAKVDLSDPDSKETPLWRAAENGSLQCVKLLIARRANINKKTDNGTTPLMAASFFGHVDCVKALIAAGANIEMKDNNHNNALAIAALHGDFECVNALLAAGANPNTLVNSGSTPLMLAAKCQPFPLDKSNNTIEKIPKNRGSYLKCVQSLLKSGARTDIQNQCGETALSIAVAGRQKEIVSLLTAAGEKR